MKIIALVAIWERPQITELCLKNWEIVQKSFKNIEFVFILSPEDAYLRENSLILRDYDQCIYPNNPVGMKMNAAIRYVYNHFEFDYIMNLGSDTMINPAIFDIYKPFIESKTPFFGINSAYLYHQASGKTVIYYVDDYPICFGSCRMIARKVIKKLDCELYDLQRNKGLDTCSSEKIKASGYNEVIIDTKNTPFILDVKSETNINSFDAIIDKGIGIINVNNNKFKKQFLPDGNF